MNEASLRLVRGYVTSRPTRGNSYPHRIQNLVIRDYCDRNSFKYQLSSTEYSTPSCYMMLEDLVNEVGKTTHGVVAFSLFSLPICQKRRLGYYKKVLEQGGVFHFALEQLSINTKDEIRIVEDVYITSQYIPQTPLGGYYLKESINKGLEELCNSVGVQPYSW